MTGTNFYAIIKENLQNNLLRMPDKTEALSSNASTSKDQIFLSTTPAPQRYDEKSRIILKTALETIILA